METSPCFAGFFVLPPLYIRLEDFSALIALAEPLPRTKQSASKILDLPEPFGPKMALKSPPNTSSVCFAKLLKHCITILFILVISLNPSLCQEPPVTDGWNVTNTYRIRVVLEHAQKFSIMCQYIGFPATSPRLMENF